MPRVLLLLLATTSVAFGDDLRIDYVRHALTATHTRYQQFIDGIRVVGGERIETVDRNGRRVVAETLARPPLLARTAAASVVAASGELVYLNVDGNARLARRVLIEEQLPRRYEQYYDATTGELLRSDPLFWNAQGRVFDPNPVAKLNDPSLRDQNDSAAAVPDAAYSIVDLPDLPASGPLIGPNVQIVDTQPPFTVHADAGQSLMFDRSQPQFEEVNAYFHIDRAQRYLQSLGYTGLRRIAGYAIPVDPHAVNGADNSFYTSGNIVGEGALYFGDGGTEDAEDSDIMLHEFGHAIQDSIAPGAFGGSSSSQSRALAEGWSDYWSFSASYAQTIVSGRDPSCIGDWDARCAGDDPSKNCGYPPGADCLRRVDGRKTMSDFVVSESPGTEHHNGEIWSSAMREIFLALTGRYGVEQGRRLTDTILLEATFGAPLNLTFASFARRLLDADSRLTGGVNAQTICASMTVRQILPVGECNQPPRGEVTAYAGDDATIQITDPRAIETLSVSVAIDGVPRGDLRIALIAPDGTRVVLQNPSTDRTVGVHTTYGISALSAEPLETLNGRSAAGSWKLEITDTTGSGAGVLVSWALAIHFVGDVPFISRGSGGRFAPPRVYVPAVAHAPGANGTNFVTDVQIFGNSLTTAYASVIFTPSGTDGFKQFTGVRLEIPPGQIVMLNDVVLSVMQTIGTGQLDIESNVTDLVVRSRTYTTSGAGSFGQSIPGLSWQEGIAAGDSATILLLRNTPEYRSNIGFAEGYGGPGTAHFTFFDTAGNTIGTADYPVLPFMHFQTPLPVDSPAVRANVTVTGFAHILAYGSVVDNRSGDGIYIPAAKAMAEETVVPAAHSAGVNGTFWRTDLWTPTGIREDVVTTTGPLFINEPFAGSRTWTASDNGTFGEYIAPIPVSSGIRSGETLQLIGIEQSAARRTNVGVINVDRTAPVGVRLIAYDAVGIEQGQLDVGIGAGQMSQVPLTAITSVALPSGRVSVWVISSTGAAVAYASVIDNRSGDPYVVIGQR
jgi:hypothetical protein